METTRISSKDLNQLIKLRIPCDVSNEESIIYIYKDLVLKYLKTDKKEINKKLETLNKLNNNKKIKEIEELIIPNNIVKIDNEIVGFTMKYLKDSVNLKLLLDSPVVDNNLKLYYLIQVGNLIDKLHKLNIGFYFNDLIEDNFVVDKNNKVFAIDLDNVSFNSNEPSTSYYLYNNKNINNLKDKYKKNVYGISYPNNNSDILCFIMMFLNTFSYHNISSLDKNSYLKYISYLEEKDVAKELTNKLKLIYENKDNINITEDLERLINTDLNIFNYQIYLDNKNKEVRK